MNSSAEGDRVIKTEFILVVTKSFQIPHRVIENGGVSGNSVYRKYHEESLYISSSK